MAPTTTEVHQVVEHFFRHKSGQLVSILTRFFGPRNLDLAETVVQETLLKACQVWPHSGIPRNPGGWITTVARNRALDIVRREKRIRDKEGEIRRWIESQAGEESPSAGMEDPQLVDDQLRMMFLCCHPVISRRAQVCLTLKTVGGLSVAEVARALLSGEDAVRKLITRAKRSIRQAKIRFELPPMEELSSRLDAVLDVLYLIFNEGYLASQGDALVRRELCDEAIRLTHLFVQDPRDMWHRLPTVKALLALMLLQSSRLPARTDAGGDLVLLADQDRSLWDQERVARGIQYLRESAEGEELSPFHLQAHLAACHAMAPNYEEADWPRILLLYDQLLELAPSPVVFLNRAVAVGMVQGPQAGLREVEKLLGNPVLAHYHLLPATVADFHRKLGNRLEAARYYRQALSLAGTGAEQRFLERRIAECAS